ncbi:MAG: hypothetical protein KBF33_06795, partial [Comamonas sp.]|nr:hypothetical protein [Comamonas sp.]
TNRVQMVCRRAMSQLQMDNDTSSYSSTDTKVSTHTYISTPFIQVGTPPSLNIQAHAVDIKNA